MDSKIYLDTFEELEARAAAGETLISYQGYLIQSKDRKFDRTKALELWHRDRKIMEDKMPQPLNKKGRPFSWSYSALSQYDTCPRQYAENRFYCTIPYVETEPQRWGNRVHLVAEQALQGLPVTEPELIKEVEPYLSLFLKKQAEGAPVEAELQVVLDRNLKPLTGNKAWFSKTAWFRAKLDVLVTTGTTVNYFDWKTGAKIKDDVDQLKICLAALSIVRPELEDFAGKLIWTRHKEVTGGANLTKEDIKKVWEHTLARVSRMEKAWATETFPEKPSGLCNGWCQVTNCKHWKPRR